MASSEKSRAIKKKVGQRYSPAERAQVMEAYLDGLKKSGGIKSIARETAGGVDDGTIEDWKKKDPGFAEKEEAALSAGTEAFGDLTEGKLMQRINAGDTTAIIFALKTKFKSRGYVEKKEISAEVAGTALNLVVSDDAAAALRKMKK